MNFKNVFRDLYDPVIDFVALNVSYKLAHDALPVAAKLAAKGFRVSRHCQHCKTEPETVRHLLFSCPLVLPARRWLQSLLKQVCDVDSVTPDELRFGLMRGPVTHRHIALFLLAEYRYCTWIVRNELRFTPNKTVTDRNVKASLEARVRCRLLVEHARQTPAEFTRLWVLPGLCKISDMGQVTTLLPT